MDEVTIKALKNLKHESKKEIIDLQRKIIKLENDYLLERDSEKRAASYQRLQDLQRKRWELIHQYR